MRVSAPKGALSLALREQIGERKTEILKFLQNSETALRVAPPPIPRMAKDQPSPLSFAQERLWFLEQLERETSAYNICRAARVTGLLVTERLELSLNEIILRHEVLRATFVVVDGLPVQKTAVGQTLSIRLIDLQQSSSTERDAEVARLITEEARCPFNLSAGPLLRAKLLRISHDDHILVLTTHHIVADAWSMGILTRELWTLYDAYANGKPSPLRKLPVQYADYAVWQREWLQGEVLEYQLSYWKQQLGTNLPVLDPPTDYPRPVTQSFRGARLSVTLEESLTEALAELSHREGVTLFLTLLAAFKTLLYRYTGQEDIVVGSPIANRSRTELEGLVGFFVNTLALRTELSGKPTFRQLLCRVRDVCLGAYAHQDLPFEKLVEELQPERDLSRNPLFQVMFLLQNAPSDTPKLAELTVGRIGVDTGTSKFDLTLGLAERDEKLVGFFEYNMDLFHQSTIKQMVGHFKILLHGIVANPDQPISTLPLLTEAERHQLVAERNDTRTNYPRNICVHELFETQVERTPEAIAVSFEGRELTYRELNARANHLAHYLKKFGVGPEKLVGICMNRSLDMVVGLLGILKAGGAYVPLDRAYPKERLEFMLNDALVSVLLTEKGLITDERSKPVLSPSTKLRTESVEGMEDGDDPPFSILDPQMKMVCMDTDWETIAGESEQNPRSEVKPDNLTYVIYTSGSTGKPKGVQIAHRSVVNCLHSVRQHVEVTENDVFLALTTISFDIAALELFLPLVIGAKVVLASRDEALDGRQLLDRVIECGATVIQATPSAWKLLLDAGWRSGEHLKALCGGEVLSRELANQLLSSGASLWNLYGPTETTIWSTITKVEPGEGPVPIGRPIANTQIYILDSQLQPVPVGAHGELYIGGDGLARGYLNRQALTGERFVRNPFIDHSDSLIFRTGDLARYRSDGNIGFLGRVDNQVKIRGYRIELGEIEAALNQHPAVKETVVVAFNEPASDDNLKSKTRTERNRSIENPKSLVAYIVSDEEQVKIFELRNFLKRKLPDYMIPSAFVFLNAFPLTPNGKVDRRKLPSPDCANPQLTEEFGAPRTEVEELIAQTWRTVLKIENVGIYDNFFELGGHSLLATQIISGLRDIFNREIPVRILFEAPTVAALAGKVENLVREGDAPEFPPIVPVSRDRPLPISINQEQLWHLNKLIPVSYFFNMPYVYQMSANVNIEALERALKEIVHRHEALRTVFREMDGNPVQTVTDGSDFQLVVIDLRMESRDESIEGVAGLILRERQQPFNLAVGPLIRAKLLRLTGVRSFLLLTVHHIIGDHWSMQVLHRELTAVYESLVQGRPVELPRLRIQFGDFASWERQLIGGDLMMRQLSYWKGQLSEPLPKLLFRKVRRRRSRSSDRRAAQKIEITGELLAAVKALANRESCSTSMVILTALTMLLYFYTRQTDICIGTLIANRRRSETETVFGPFLNTVVIRLQVSHGMTCTQLLKDVRAATLDAAAHQELAFEKLAQVLEEEPNVDRSSLFQVLYNYQKIQSEIPRPAGMVLAPFPVGRVVETSGIAITAIDMIFDVRESSTMLTVTVNSRSGVLDETQTVRLKEHITSMLETLISLESRVE